MARPEIKTWQNLEAAFAGESMAHIKYRYFAKLARAAGDEDTARIFEQTADQEVMHAFGHLDLLYPAADITPAKALQIAIEGETDFPEAVAAMVRFPPDGGRRRQRCGRGRDRRADQRVQRTRRPV